MKCAALPKNMTDDIFLAQILGFWCKLLKGSVSRDNRRDDGTDLGTGSLQRAAF
jgi:hypothetical protein